MKQNIALAFLKYTLHCGCFAPRREMVDLGLMILNGADEMFYQSSTKLPSTAASFSLLPNDMTD